jgi:uncharacterized protein YqgC (DUF456 family)
METALLFWLLALVLVAAGLVGLFLPALPGAPLILAGLVIAAWTEDFRYAGLWTIVALALITLLSLAVDFWATMFGAKKFGASKRAGVGAVIGLAVGVFIGFPGLIFGPFIGAMAGELTVRKDLRQATRAGIGATIGLALGAALKLALAFTMIGIFLAVRFVS